MKNIVTLLATAAVAALSLNAFAQTVSPVQSTARPFGLDIVDKVQLAGSDAASATFQYSVLPGLSSYLSSALPEGRGVNDRAHLLDPSKLKLATDSNVRAYFIGEGAGYENSLGFNTAGGGVTSGNPELIFPNASTGGRRTASTPLQAGDFVDLGTILGGQKLDLFLIANGATRSPGEVYSTDSSVNPDGINHVVSFATIHDSYLVIGFEDLLGGGDRDFNDLLFAIDIGALNVAALTGTPEPSTYMTMGLFLVGGVWVARRRKAQKAANA
jgi:hypothetical protein